MAGSDPQQSLIGIIFRFREIKNTLKADIEAMLKDFTTWRLHFFLDLYNKKPGSKFFEIRRYFSKIAGNSADTAVNPLRNDDAPLS